MTLPQLLACALRQRTGDQDARYVFGLGEWAIESAKGQACLITKLKTPDGFEVCFGSVRRGPFARPESAARCRDARSGRPVGGILPNDFELTRRRTRSLGSRMARYGRPPDATRERLAEENND